MDGLASLAAAAALFDPPTPSTNSSSLTHSLDLDLAPKKTKRSIPSSPAKKRKKVKEVKEEIDDESCASSCPDPTPAPVMSPKDCGFSEDTPVVRSLLRCLTPQVRLRCQYEWFYSTIDRDYFKQNEFLACLNHMGLHEASNLTKEEWAAVRIYMGAAIGRPRRFSAAFLKGEQAKLDTYRAQVRRMQYMYSQDDPPPPENDFPFQVYFPVRVGDYVTVSHSPTCSLQRGLVLSLNAVSEEATDFRIQFERADLGHLLVEDTDLAIHGEAEVMFPHERDGESSVLEEQGGARVGQLTSTEDVFFRTTWSRCLDEAIDIHAQVAASDDNCKKEELEDSDNATQGKDGFKNVDEVSVVCTACLLFLRVVSTRTEMDSAVFPANTSAFLMHKINQHHVPDSQLQHKLTMLFMLCQNYNHNQASSFRE